MEISKDLHIQGVVRVTSDSPGPHVVMFSGTMMRSAGSTRLKRSSSTSSVASAPYCEGPSLSPGSINQDAIAAERRYVKHNMNRMFRENYGPEIDRNSYEFRRTQELKPVLETCDYFLDFHSAPIADAPYLVAEQKAVEFYSKLGIPRIMTGWSKFSSGAIGGDAENYANAHGAISATLESGSHFEKSSNDVAYKAAISLLSLLKMIEGDELPSTVEADVFEMYSVVTKEFDDFRYGDEVRNFQFLKKDQAFAYQNGQPLNVSEDSYLLIPMKPGDTKVHEEVCYLGRIVPRLDSATVAGRAS